MGTTVNGLPYPEPSDPIAAGAAVIQGLTEKLRFWTIAHTWASMTPTQTTVEYTYPVGLFTATPVAVLGSGHSYSVFNAITFATYTRLYIRSSTTSSYTNVQTYVFLIQPTI